MSYEVLLDYLPNIVICQEVKHLMYAAGLGLLIGCERAFKHKAASIRTFALLSAGSALFTLLSTMATSNSPDSMVDNSRIAAQIVSGLGFLGAGVIFRYQDKLSGITTAVMIWFTAAVGMACGFGKISLAVSAVAIYYAILIVGELLHRLAGTKKDQDDDD